jgi:glycosyltransferase involved in cell wall biosynthesis
MIPVVFATYNGASRLGETLRGFERVNSPPGGWCLIVVDNASTDGSMEIIRSFEGRLPLIRLFEGRRGKNFAMNRVVDVASEKVAGPDDLIVFTDDDITPDPDWLIRLHQAAARAPECDMFGGAIVPGWPTPPPSWLQALTNQFGVLFAATSTRSGPCKADELWGPNMAFRRRVFDAGHRFDIRVGPNGQEVYAMGSETEFVTRLERAGFRAYFADDAIVEHRIRPQQLDRKWVMNRARNHGRGYGRRVRMKAEGRGKSRSQLPWGTVQRVVYEGLGAVASVVPNDSWRMRVHFQRAWWRGVGDAWKV